MGAGAGRGGAGKRRCIELRESHCVRACMHMCESVCVCMWISPQLPPVSESGHINVHLCLSRESAMGVAGHYV